MTERQDTKGLSVSNKKLSIAESVHEDFPHNHLDEISVIGENVHSPDKNIWSLSNATENNRGSSNSREHTLFGLYSETYALAASTNTADEFPQVI